MKRRKRCCSSGSPEHTLFALLEQEDIDAALAWLSQHPKLNVNATRDNTTEPNDSDRTLLMQACYSTRAGAADVVAVLLDRGAGVNTFDQGLWTPLHFAARYGLPEMVTALLEAGAVADMSNRRGNSALAGCCGRRDEFALPIARLLLDTWKHKINSVFDICGSTLLTVACRWGRTDVVALLLENGSAVNTGNRNGITPLMCAVENPYYAADIVRVLMAAGADAALRDIRQRTVFDFAVNATGHIMRMLAAHKIVMPAHRSTTLVLPVTCPDPVGVMREAIKLGRCSVDSYKVSDAFTDHAASKPYYVWALLRCASHKGPTLNSITPSLTKAAKPGLWYWVNTEYVSRNHLNGETLLHAAARVNQYHAVQALMTQWVNPFLLDDQGKTAIEHTTDACVRAALERYARQPLCRQVADWYGPYFIARARAFLLVLHRARASGALKVPPRDVVHMILSRLRVVEYV